MEWLLLWRWCEHFLFINHTFHQPRPTFLALRLLPEHLQHLRAVWFRARPTGALVGVLSARALYASVVDEAVVVRNLRQFEETTAVEREHAQSGSV